MELCADTGSKVACYHMARYFEKKGDFKQAITFFQQASAISNAMRLCRVCCITSRRIVIDEFHTRQYKLCLLIDSN
jgi:hypothetical protein